MQLQGLYERALRFDFLSAEEGVFLFEHAPLTELMYVANELRKIQVPHGKVTWIIDRNVNTTNVCIANCKFCNFYRIPGHPDAYITDIETYKRKIDETFKYGGEQLLLQGGHHPDLERVARDRGTVRSRRGVRRRREGSGGPCSRGRRGWRR